MTQDPGTLCPACGAPLPAPAGEVRVLCSWCHAQAAAGAPPTARELLLVDQGDHAEAAALLVQHLRARFPFPIAVAGGRPRLAPFWSVVTADGEILAGPATREEPVLLRRVTLPALPARPLAQGEATTATRCAADLPLASFLATAHGGADQPPAAGVERAWLVWVPVRFWRVRAGGLATTAVTVADVTQPVVAPFPGPQPALAPRASALAPLAAYTACLLLLGRLLPLPLHVSAAAVLCALALWAWRRPAAGDEDAPPAVTEGS